MSSATIDTLTTRFEADIQKFEASMKKMVSAAQDSSKGVQVEAEKVEGAWGNVGEAIDKVFSTSRLAMIEEGSTKIGVFGSALEALGPAGLAAAAGIAAVGFALEEAHKAMEWAEEIDKFSKSVGTSTQNLQAFDDANIATSVGLKEGRSNLEEFSGVMAKFQAHLGDKKSSKWFDAIGLSRDEIKGTTDTVLQLQVVLEKVADMPSQSNRIGALNALGLGSFKEIVADGSEGVEKYVAAIRDAQSAGGLISDADIAKMAEMNDHVALMQQRIGQDLRKAFLDAAPAVDGLATFLDKCARMIVKITEDVPAAIGGIAKLAHTIEPLVAFDGWLSKIKSQSDAHDEQMYQQSHDGKHPVSAFVTEANRFIFGAPGKSGDAPSGWDGLLSDGRGYNMKNGVMDVLSGRSKADWTGSDLERDRHPNTAATQFGHDPVKKGPKDRTDQIEATSDKEIAAAIKAEIEARLAITTDLDERAAIQAGLLQQEREAALKKVDDDLKLKKITPDAANKIKSAVNDTYDDKAYLASKQNAQAKLDRDKAFLDKLTALQVQELTSEAGRAQTVDDWAKLTLDAYNKQKANDQADFEDDIAKKFSAGQLTIYQAMDLIGENKKEQAQKDADETKRIDDTVREKKQAFANTLIGYVTDTLQLEAQMASTAVQRNAIEKQILDIRQKQAREALEDDIKKNNRSPEDASKLRSGLATQQSTEQASFADQHKNPFQSYTDGLKDVNTQISDIETDGFKQITDGFVGLVDGTKTVAQAFSDMAKSIIDDIARIIIEQTLLNALGFGTGGGAGGGFFGGFLSLIGLGNNKTGLGVGSGNLSTSTGDGLMTAATGTAVSPGGPTLIGEHGAEVMDIPAGARIRPALLGSMAMPQTATGTSINAPVNVTVNAQGAFSAAWVQQQAYTAAYAGGQAAVRQTKTDLNKASARRF